MHKKAINMYWVCGICSRSHSLSLSYARFYPPRYNSLCSITMLPMIIFMLQILCSGCTREPKREEINNDSHLGHEGQKHRMEDVAGVHEHHRQ